MAVQNSFNEVIKTLGEDWINLSNEDRNQLREEWVARRLMTTDNPRNADYLKRFTEEAYADVAQPQEEGLFSNIKSYKDVPGGLWRQAIRTFTTPQQYLQSAFRQPVDRPVLERVASPFKEAGKYLIGEEEKYPYDWYTDPMLLAGLPKLITSVPSFLAKQLPTLIKAGRGAIKEGGKLAKRIHPPQAGEAVAKTVPEEVAAAIRGVPGRAPIPGEVPPLTTVGTPRPLTTPPAGSYRQAMGRLTPHFPKEEAQRVAEFVARNPNDVISQAVKSKEVLRPEIVEQIRTRILPSVELPSASRMVRPPGATTPPPLRSQSPESIIEQINNIDPTKPGAWMNAVKQSLGIK